MAVHDQAIENLKRSATAAMASGRTTRSKEPIRSRVLMDSDQVDVVQRFAFTAGAVVGAATVVAIVLLIRCC